MTSQRTVLCFGDSLTWGWIPQETAATSSRYPADSRWPVVVANDLGPGFALIEEGLNGRTTNVDDPFEPNLNGSLALPIALASHAPVDIVVLLLGVNDLKYYFERTAFDIALAISSLVGMIRSAAGIAGTEYAAPRVLVVSPPPPTEIRNAWLAELFAGARSKAEQLGPLLASLSQAQGFDFLDSSEFIEVGGIDGVHLSEANNRDLGHAIAAKIVDLYR